MHRTSSFVRLVVPAMRDAGNRASISYVFTPEKDGMAHCQLELTDDDRRKTDLPKVLGLSYGDTKGSGRPVTEEAPIRSRRTRTIDLGPVTQPEPFKRAAREFDHRVLDETGQNGPSCTTFVRYMLDRGGILYIPPWDERVRPAQLADKILQRLLDEKRPAQINAAPHASDIHDNDDAPAADASPTPAPPPAP